MSRLHGSAAEQHAGSRVFSFFGAFFTLKLLRGDDRNPATWPDLHAVRSWLQVPPLHKHGTAEDLKMPFIIESLPS